MEKKKYVLKTEVEKQEKSADGTENAEHIIDMIDRAKMCLNNIQDNTDLAVNVFKLEKQQIDEDELDAIQLMCQEMIDIEQQSNDIFQEIEEIENLINNKMNIKEFMVEEILKKVLVLEFHSQEIVDKLLKTE